MSDELLQEIQALKSALHALSDRVRELEARVSARPASAAAARVAPDPPAPVLPRPVPAAPQATAHRPAATRESLETRIGRYWLNWLGIGSLVLGVAFFILYSFQYLGPVAKLAIGYAVGAALLGAGVWLERRANLGWYARGLIGGGWAVVYFTAYAMHHLPAVRVLASALVDLLLLFLVAAAAVRHALTYRSQAITALAFSLGFITTSISTVTYFTLASSTLLVVALVIVAVRMRWHGLCLYGVLGSYLTHLAWVGRQIAMSPMIAVHTGTAAEAQFWLNAGFLILYWLAYTVAILGLEERTIRARNALLTATLANGLLFIHQLLAGMEPVYPQQQYLALLGVGALTAILSPVAERRRLWSPMGGDTPSDPRGFAWRSQAAGGVEGSAVSTTLLLLGLTFLTLAIPERLTARWTSYLWTAEVALLTWIGLRYHRWAYRLFAFGLAVVVFGRLMAMDLWRTATLPVLGQAIPWRVLIGLVAILAFGLSAASYRLPRYRPAHRPIERQAFHAYAMAAGVIAWLLTILEGSRGLLSLWWALEASMMALLGWWLRDRALRLFGALWFVVVALTVLVDLVTDPSWWNPWATGGTVAILYGMSALSRREPAGATFAVERSFRHAYAAAGSMALTALLWVEVSRHWISLAWGMEGLALVAVGFGLRDRVFRVSGLGVFGLLVLKILFVDLAEAETIYRILSFIAAGAVLLLASFAYATYMGKATKIRR